MTDCNPGCRPLPPSRKSVRTFSECDAARVAREAVASTGATPEMVLACIAKGMGFTHISLSRPRVVQSGLVPARVIAGAIVAALESLVKLIEWLQRFIAAHPTIAKAIAALEVLHEVVKAVKKIEDFFAEEPPPQVTVDSAIGDNFCKCKKTDPGKNTRGLINIIKDGG